MKKTKIITIPARKASPARKKKVSQRVCDFCSATIPDHGSYGWYPSCSICKRDCCRKHNQPDPDEPSDYPDWFCNICMPLILPARRAMKERHWKEEEEIENKIKEQSLGTSI